MCFWRNRFWVKMTLFFFTLMLLYQPAYAGEELPDVFVTSFQYIQNNPPVAYVSEAQAQQLARDYQRMGYVVKQGTLAQLDQLMLASNKGSTAELDNKNIHTGEGENAETSPECEKPGKPVLRDGKPLDDSKKNDKQKDNGKISHQNQNCNPGNSSSGNPQANPQPISQSNSQSDQQQQSSHDDVETQSVPGSASEPIPEPMPEPLPQSYPQTSVGVHADLSYGASGSNSDLAKVFFILAGVVVVGVFVVFAGKYIADLVQGKEHDLWWEFIFNSTFLDTDSGEHGRFYGVKIATGFVSSDLFQVALVGEIGNTDLELVLNEYPNPVELDLSGKYWMLGATARLHLTDKLVNASYLYLDFMGGSTDHRETDVIGAARLGASFGINDYVRLGASFGAQYIGLDEDQGFVNDGDNYWLTFGVEMGVRF